MFIKFSIRSLKQIKRTLQKGYCKQNVHTYLSIYLSIIQIQIQMKTNWF